MSLGKFHLVYVQSMEMEIVVSLYLLANIFVLVESSFRFELIKIRQAMVSVNMEEYSSPCTCRNICFAIKCTAFTIQRTDGVLKCGFTSNPTEFVLEDLTQAPNAKTFIASDLTEIITSGPAELDLSGVPELQTHYFASDVSTRNGSLSGVESVCEEQGGRIAVVETVDEWEQMIEAVGADTYLWTGLRYINGEVKWTNGQLFYTSNLAVQGQGIEETPSPWRSCIRLKYGELYAGDCFTNNPLRTLCMM